MTTVRSPSITASSALQFTRLPRTVGLPVAYHRRAVARASVILLLCCPVYAQWGRDINPGMGPQLVVSVRGELADIVAAPEAQRGVLIERFVEAHGTARIEAIKRFRNPELKPLFLRLLDHADWQVQHRALLALEYFGGDDVLNRAFKLLEHPHSRLREKAAITCIKLWRGKTPPVDVAARIRDEEDFHVQACLRALQLRVAGRLTVERMGMEHRVTDKRGVLRTPFLSGMPRDLRKPRARTGSGSAARLPAATRWTTPLLGQGEEEVQGTSLQPFGNERAGGMVHTGLDVGACLDGAGFYAAADGIVRLVHSGSDMGTLIVTEHNLDGKRLVNAVYMHGGDTVFVAAGDRITCGQLLGTMGMSFSAENGGHYAHLHYGIYPGPFDMKHNYGYKRRTDGLRDWIDPARFLPRWIARTRPLVDGLRGLGKPYAGILQAIEREQFGRAYAAAIKLRDSHGPGSEIFVDANTLATKLRGAPRRAVTRAERMRDGGYPAEALRRLKQHAAACKGIPGTEAVYAAVATWEADPLFRKALKGEGRFESVARRANRTKDERKMRSMWEKLLADYGDTCLADRIREQLR